MRYKKIILTLAVVGMALILFSYHNDSYQNLFTRFEKNSPEELTIEDIDTNEFPPGFPNIKMDAVEQILNFPLPRFKSNHKLLSNFLWMDPTFIGGNGLKKISRQQSIKNSADIQLELALHWNYYLQICPNTNGDAKAYGRQGTLQNAWLNIANEHPELPLSAISFWIGMKGNHVMSQKLGDNCYLRDEKNNFITDVIDNNGVHRRGKLFSPNISLDTIALDGLKQRHLLENIFQYLKRPLNCFNEEDEIFTVYDSSILKKEPSLVADKTKMKINNWDIYQAEKIKQIQITYRDSFMNLPQMKNSIYSVYGIDGHPHYRFAYSAMRKANTPINEKYYSTPDFYPRYPSNWRYWSGPWHGLSWIFESRPNEIALGDSLYSPFVAAGWDNNPIKNICPAQWLGLLKLLAMTGAEFFYTGFFNERQPFANPETYIWQAAMPVYAQAITSRFENIFRHGEIMNVPEFIFPSGDKRIMIVAKKIIGKKIYAITGTIQNLSNKKGDAPLNAIAEINLDGAKLKFEVRRQGSTYIYNAEDSQHPVFYQLDAWHEASHPSRWSKDFYFEAELFDNDEKNISIKTELPANAKENDFSSFTSYISCYKSSSLKYFFTPRDSAASFLFQILMRGKEKKSGIKIFLDGTEIAEIKNNIEQNWKWFFIDEKKFPLSFKNLTNKIHELSITPSDNTIEINKFVLKKISDKK
ncbi:MAG: hypothetical protein HY063_05070 [Bacteroidetes bacterium]|nr:hypothetical protein [Bacteroidota bacterium]